MKIQQWFFVTKEHLRKRAHSSYLWPLAAHSSLRTNDNKPQEAFYIRRLPWFVVKNKQINKISSSIFGSIETARSKICSEKYSNSTPGCTDCADFVFFKCCGHGHNEPFWRIHNLVEWMSERFFLFIFIFILWIYKIAMEGKKKLSD